MRAIYLLVVKIKSNFRQKERREYTRGSMEASSSFSQWMALLTESTSFSAGICTTMILAWMKYFRSPSCTCNHKFSVYKVSFCRINNMVGFRRRQVIFIIYYMQPGWLYGEDILLSCNININININIDIVII